MIKNPYITEIETNITKKLNPHGMTHLALENHISIDNKAYNTFQESLFIDGNDVESIYDSSLGPVYVLGYNPSKTFVNLSINLDERIKILKSITSRYLIVSALKKYMNLEARDFFTDKNESSFKIPDIFFEKKAIEIVKTLEKVINMYIDSGLDIWTINTSESLITKIPGIYNDPFLGPHLSNLSEIRSFSIHRYSIDKGGLTIFFNN